MFWCVYLFTVFNHMRHTQYVLGAAYFSHLEGVSPPSPGGMDHHTTPTQCMWKDLEQEGWMVSTKLELEPQTSV